MRAACNLIKATTRDLAVALRPPFPYIRFAHYYLVSSPAPSLFKSVYSAGGEWPVTFSYGRFEKKRRMEIGRTGRFGRLDSDRDGKKRFLDTARRSGNAAWRDQLVVQLKKTEKWNRSTEEEEKNRLKKRFENGSLASVISSANGTEGVKTSDV